MGTKNNPGDFDCYANAEPDEPMFVLLGRDKHAPTLVWLWAVLRELDGESPAKVAEAQYCVLEMIKWATGHGRQVVGLGQSVLAGTMDLIRQVNAAVDDLDKRPGNKPTGVDAMRRFLSRTEFEKSAPQ